MNIGLSREGTRLCGHRSELSTRAVRTQACDEIESNTTLYAHAVGFEELISI